LSNLDAKLRVQTRLEIQKLHRELGITSLFVTHDQVEAMTLAQRMIVMNAGRMEQIGTPEEVYAWPATTFVAGFIGSPPMNLLEGQVLASDRFSAGGIGLAIEATPAGAAPGTPSANGPAAILGVRPEHLVVGDAGWPVTVEMVEVLGAERLIYTRLGSARLVVRTEDGIHRPVAGDHLFVQPMPGRLHWFDPATHARLAGKGAI
jgi:sn-glycerol 3-phosphate transport system ATP-binding protein